MARQGWLWKMIAGVCIAFACPSLSANNLQFGAVTCDGHAIHTTIAWENSWNLATAPANHDAVWVFAKIRRGLGPWEHLQFHDSPNAHSTGNPFLLGLDPAPLGEGVMVGNIGNGATDIPATALRLQLIQPLTPGIYEIQILGIEMAYVPEEPYWLGDGASNYSLHDSSNGQPLFVVSEDAIPAGMLSATGGKGPSGEIPTAFPKGFGGFYLMKYELSQAQYVDFLNTLTFEQQQLRTASDPAGVEGTLALAGVNANRSAVVLAAHGHAPSPAARYACNLDGGSANGDQDGQDRACNWLSWPDLAAYLDWAALRPLTELEFEKVSRGPLAPSPNEFAWGTDEIIDANTLLHDGSAQEAVSETGTATAGLGSHGYAGPQGPLRCGFAGHANSDRLQAGAGYYGHMELSGNLWELCVSTRATGLGFSGNHGDGTLAENGEADVPTWPGPDGIGFKGGGWNSGIIPGFRDLAVSDRFYIDWATDLRRNTSGGRGAR